MQDTKTTGSTPKTATNRQKGQLRFASEVVGRYKILYEQGKKEVQTQEVAFELLSILFENLDQFALGPGKFLCSPELTERVKNNAALIYAVEKMKGETSMQALLSRKLRMIENDQPVWF